MRKALLTESFNRKLRRQSVSAQHVFEDLNPESLAQKVLVSAHENEQRKSNAPKSTGEVLSGEFVAGLSPPMRGCCRKLDVIAVPGAEAPMVLYTYERHFEAHRAYFERFATGVECYLNGDWVWAREYLVWCYAQNPADRPAVVLLEYMAAKRFAAPKGWLGCRRDDYMYEDDADALRV